MCLGAFFVFIFIMRLEYQREGNISRYYFSLEFWGDGDDGGGGGTLSPAKDVADHRDDVQEQRGVLRVRLETRIPGGGGFPKEYLREKEERL